MKLLLALDVHEVDLDLKKLKVNLNKGKNFEHKWIPEEQRHIPLLILRDISEEEIVSLSQKLELSLQKESSFELKLEGVGAFPNQEQGRLLWLGVQNKKELRALQENLRELLHEYLPENKEEGSKKPYLPVVRIRNHRNVSDLISPYENSDFGKTSIYRVILYEMTSAGAFPTYHIREVYPLIKI
jgi:2'-5' RNA ligase